MDTYSSYWSAKCPTDRIWRRGSTVIAHSPAPPPYFPSVVPLQHALSRIGLAQLRHSAMSLVDMIKALMKLYREYPWWRWSRRAAFFIPLSNVEKKVCAFDSPARIILTRTSSCPGTLATSYSSCTWIRRPHCGHAICSSICHSFPVPTKAKTLTVPPYRLDFASGEYALRTSCSNISTLYRCSEGRPRQTSADVSALNVFTLPPLGHIYSRWRPALPSNNMIWTSEIWQPNVLHHTPCMMGKIGSDCHFGLRDMNFFEKRCFYCIVEMRQKM